MDRDELGNRSFYTLPKRNETSKPTLNSSATPDELSKLILKNEIGKDHLFISAFGKRSLVYCDHTASGRPLDFIEKFMQQQVLPTYANTHTTSSITGLQSTLYRHEARSIIRNAVRASENDAVIFAGSGSTAAVQLLISALALETPPVVFIGPSEHHSAELPWINAKCHIVRIHENENGQPDYDELDHVMATWKTTGIPLVGCFSAASNVTGVMSDTVRLAQIIHKHDGLSVFDYATAAPYVKIDMHPAAPNASKDAIFFSPHKFPGGVNTPGILVASKKLFRNRVPHGGGGGGTVFWVSNQNHRFLAEPEEREESGTPDLVGSIRCGMIMQLKESIGSEFITDREMQIAKKAVDRLRKIDNLELLLPSVSNRLPIFSFMIRVPDSTLYLHYNFVSAVLNDIFGIQTRGGCVCAGPYAQELLGMRAVSGLPERFENILIEDARLDRIHLRRAHESSQYEILRPGFVRFSLPYFFDDEQIDNVLKAIEWVAVNAWKLLPHYVFDCETGEWKHSKNLSYHDRRWLGDVRFSANGVEVKELTVENKHGTVCKTLSEALVDADRIARDNKVRPQNADQSTGFQGEAHELRWFLLPSEARDLFKKNNIPENLKSSPFRVRTEIPKSSFADYKLVEELVEKLKNVKNWDKSTYKPKVETPDKSENFKKNEKRKHDNSTKNGGEQQDAACTDDVCVPCLMPRKKKIKTEKTKTQIGKKRKAVHPPKVLLRKVGDAIEEYDMIENGDRVIVGLSGGKDSMTLLHSLLQYRYIAKAQRKIDFTIGALTVDPQVASYDPSSLIPYMEELGVEYIYQEVPIFANAQKLPDLRSICSYCSRMKRGIMYSAMREKKWNVLALGQHLDDCAESFLMSAFHNSQLFTMKANYTVKEGDLRVIRPLVYVRETETRNFAESNKLPVIPENCPACFSEPKERNRMKQLLAQQEILHPHLFHSLKKAMKPLLGMKIENHFSKGNKNGKSEDMDEKESQEVEKLNNATK